jgi:hypothetical protein
MRWGEPTRLPPVRRGRGLTAAALLAVGLVAAYAILAVLSLTSVAPSLLEHVPTTLQGIIRPGSVSAAQPKPADVVTPTKSVTLGDLSVQFGFSTGSNTKVFGLENTATLPIDLSLEVVGAPGVQAAFEGSGTRTHLGVGKQTKVTVRTDPLHAGALTGSVDISISGVSQTLSVPLTGAQAPLPPGAVVATPEANGAVKVTWPASPSTGVPQASSMPPAPTDAPSTTRSARSPPA